MMTEEEAALRALRRERVARVKRLMRWLPRRATVHRYPFIGWFADSVRKRSFLWSFRTRSAVPAIYAGCILAFTPIYGIQVPLALLLAFLIRANLPILTGLQFITNPVTVLPIYFAAFAIGRVFLQLFGLECPHLSVEEFRLIFEAAVRLELKHSLGYVLQVGGITTVGGWMMGLFSAAILGMVYRFSAYEVAKTYKRLQELQGKRELAQRDQACRQEKRRKNRFPKSRRI
jgi:uncharacterized protein (DUF2062 family)